MTLDTPPHESHWHRDLKRNLLPYFIELCRKSAYSKYYVIAGKRKVGIVGYGSLGKFLANAIMTDPRAKEELELVFVWNRTPEKVLEDVKNGILPEHVFLKDLNEFGSRNAELIVEVAHHGNYRNNGTKIFGNCKLYGWVTNLLREPIFGEEHTRPIEAKQRS